MFVESSGHHLRQPSCSVFTDRHIPPPTGQIEPSALIQRRGVKESDENKPAKSENKPEEEVDGGKEKT